MKVFREDFLGSHHEKNLTVASLQVLNKAKELTLIFEEICMLLVRYCKSLLLECTYTCRIGVPLVVKKEAVVDYKYIGNVAN